MSKHDNKFLIKTYGTCTNGYDPFLEENVTCVRMDKNILMYCWMNVTSHLYERFERLKENILT